MVEKERGGDTKVTSVSVSKRFLEFIKEYDLSPTECFRRGVAVSLFDLGVGVYQSEKNGERFIFVQKFLKQLDEDESLKNDYENMKAFLEIKGKVEEIKEIIKVMDEKDGKS